MNWYNRQLKIAFPSGVVKKWTTEELSKIKSLLEEGKSHRYIGDLFGVNSGVIKRVNDKYKWRDRDKERMGKYKWVLSLYRLPPHGKGMSVSKIREIYKIPDSVVKRALESFGIEGEWRSYEEARGMVPEGEIRKKIREDKDFIQELLDEGYRLNQIAELYDLPRESMAYYLRSFDIPTVSEKGKESRKNFIRKKSLELMNKGWSLEDISKELKISPATIKSVLIETGEYYNNIQQTYMTDAEQQKIKDLYNEGKSIAEIGRIMNRSTAGVGSFLIREGLYEREALNIFYPTPEQESQIDHWYTLPPEGEGKSFYWISSKLRVTVDQLIGWFNSTGRGRRSKEEQVRTDFSRNQYRLNAREYWEEIGNFENHLKRMNTREKAVRCLSGFVAQLLNEDSKMAGAVKEKYTQIINNHTFPDEVPQGTTI